MLVKVVEFVLTNNYFEFGQKVLHQFSGTVIFLIWTHGKEKLENFLKELNSFSGHIKFTFDSDKENNTYLDVNINLSNGHLMTNMYVKPTDRHQYLDYSSCHLNRIKRSIV